MKSLNTIVNRLFVVACVLMLAITVSAQGPSHSSPFSFYGIGDRMDNAFGRAKAMGGLSAASLDSFNVNVLNPAGLTGIQHGTFHFAMETETKRINGDQWYGDGYLPHMSLAFPILRNRLSVAGSLLPYSKVNYQIFDNQSGSLEFGETFTYQGYGDLYQYNFSLGYKIFQDKKNSLSVGLGLSRVRGQIVRYDSMSVRGEISVVETVTYPDLTIDPEYIGQDLHLNVEIDSSKASVDTSIERSNTEALAIKNEAATILQGVYSVLGFNYERIYSSTANSVKSFNIGLNMNGSTALQGERITNSQTFFNGIQVDQLNGDTLAGEVLLPKAFAVGFALKKRSKGDVDATPDYEFGIEYRQKYWSEYRNYGQKENAFDDDYMIIVGGEYLPNKLAHKKSMAYRFGMYYGKDRLSLNGSQVTTSGIRFGVGIPFRTINRSMPTESKVNIGIEMGQRGASGVLYEQYMRATVGFTFNNRWFVKKKFL